MRQPGIGAFGTYVVRYFTARTLIERKASSRVGYTGGVEDTPLHDRNGPILEVQESLVMGTFWFRGTAIPMPFSVIRMSE